MKKSTAIKYAGGKLKLAKLIGVTSGAITLWGDEIPEGKQLLLEHLSGGKLKADPKCYAKLIGWHKLPLHTRKKLPLESLRQQVQHKPQSSESQTA